MTDVPVGPEVTPRRSRLPIAIGVLILALLVALAALLSGLGSRWGWWPFRNGFQILQWSAYAAIVVGVLSLIALAIIRPGRSRLGFAFSLVALIISLVVIAIPWQARHAASGAPPIHDITTDTENPPTFVAIVPLRANAANPSEYGGPEVARQQKQAYPDIQPLLMNMSRDRAFQRALDAAKGMGWEIVAADPDDGRIEATAQTFWFGFKDDVVVRLTAVGERTILDVRSVSRVGRGDTGTNARRIRAYLKKVSGA